MDSRFCIGALEEKLVPFGTPAIVNTDQGAPFIAYAFTSVVQAADIRICMDGKGAWRDNIFIERLWWSLKHEEVYLRAHDSEWDVRRHLRA